MDPYFGRFNTARQDRWVFGDRETGAYLVKFAWTKIIRHQLVKGTASPDDPALTDYWINAANAVSAFLGVSLLRGSSRQWHGWDSLGCLGWQASTLRLGMRPWGDGITADAHLVIRCDAGNFAETEGHCGSEGSWPIRVENHTELQLAGLGVRLLRPVRKNKPERVGSALFKPLRQLIESVKQTLPG